MKYEQKKDGTFELYIPGEKTWTSIEILKQFLKRFQNIYCFLEAGEYLVIVTTNKIGTLFQIQKKEQYIFKNEVDLQLEVRRVPFYMKSKDSSSFQDNFYYYQGDFYCLSSMLSSSFNVYEQVERISKESYEQAKKNGIFIKKRRDISSL